MTSKPCTLKKYLSRRALTLIAAAFILTLVLAIDAPKLRADDWIIDDTQVIENQTYSVSGSIVIEDGGTLVLRNAILEIEQTSDSAYNITVKSGGKLVLENSTIKSSTGYPYTIIVEGELNSTGSTIEDIGLQSKQGIRGDGDTPLILLKDTVVRYKATGYVIYISSTIDGNPDTYGNLTIDNVTLVKITGYPDYAVYVKGDTAFNITRMHPLENSTTRNGLYISFFDANTKTPKATAYIRYINTSKLEYTSARPQNLTLNLTDSSFGSIEINVWWPSSTLSQKLYINGLNLSNKNSQSSIKGVEGVIEHLTCNGSLSIENSNITLRNSVVNHTYFGTALSVSLHPGSRVNILNSTIALSYNYGQTSDSLAADVYVEYIGSNGLGELVIEDSMLLGVRGSLGLYIDESVAGKARIVVNNSVVRGVSFREWSRGSGAEALKHLLIENTSLIDGKPVTLVRDAENLTLSGEHGQILVYNSTNIRIENVSMNSTAPGAIVVASSDAVIDNSSIGCSYYLYNILAGNSHLTIEGTRINVTDTPYPGATVGIEAVHSILEARGINTTAGDRSSGVMSLLAKDQSEAAVLDSEITRVRARDYSKLVINKTKVYADPDHTGVFTSYVWQGPAGAHTLVILNSTIKAGRGVKAARNYYVYIAGSTIESSNIYNNNILEPRDGGNYTLEDNIFEYKGSSIAGNLVYIDAYGHRDYGLVFRNNTLVGPAKDLLYINGHDGGRGSLSVTGNSFREGVVSIHIRESREADIEDNRIQGSPEYPGGIYIEGSEIGHYIHVIENNTINGKPVVYLYEEQGSYTGIAELIAVASNATVEDSVFNSTLASIILVNGNATLRNTAFNLSNLNYPSHPPMIYIGYSSTLKLEDTNFTLHTDSNKPLYGVIWSARVNSADQPNVVILNHTRINGSSNTLVTTVYSGNTRVIVEDTTIEWQSDSSVFYLSIQGSEDRSLLIMRDTNITCTQNTHIIHSSIHSVFIENVEARAEASSSTAYLAYVYSQNAQVHPYVYIADTALRGLGVYISGGYGYLENLTLDGLNKMSTAIELGGGAYVVAVDSRITNYTANAVKSYRGGGVWLVNTSIEEGFTGYVGSGAVYLGYTEAWIGGSTLSQTEGNAVYITDSNLTIHESILSGNKGYGLYIYRNSLVNATHNYWGSESGPEVNPEETDGNDPEEIYNNTGGGNTLYYQPYLTGEPGGGEPPQITVESPSNNSVLKGLVDLNVTYSDDYGVMLVAVFLNGSPVAFLEPGANHTQLDTSKWSDGSYELEFAAYDYHGHRSSEKLKVNVSNEEPSARIVEPEDNALVGGIVRFTLYVYDNDLDHSELYVGDNKVETFARDRKGYIWYNWDSTSVGDGDYKVNLTAWDAGGNKASHVIQVTVDNTEPEINDVSPANNSYLRDVVNVSFKASDAHGDSYYMYINGTLVDSGDYTNGAQITYTLDTRSYIDGAYELAIRATDKVGNEGIVTRTLFFDNTRPSSSIESPGDGDTVSGTVEIRVNASDNMGVSQVLIYINGTKVYEGSGAGVHTYTWDVPSDPGETYNITAVTVDNAGNTDEDTVIVNTPPEPIPEPAAVVAVLLAAALAGILLFGRSRLIKS